ncbi:TrkH family potassium uptake protein [Bacillus massiliigorillae]|uniref:TrkH family potassium uptake protein n=1 Tax=Bacillus massiliigorillae TaxID=1243664 RepID=UPI0003AA7E6D|nr:TrkH family potassium uptake protein [Bacillus massiliigorillae]
MQKLNKDLLNKLTPAQLIVVYYFLAVTVSTILLKLPVALKPGVELSVVDALFVAASAVSVTGLTTIDISQTFSVTGDFILMFVLQFGGIGIMTLGTFMWLLFKKKIGFKERRLIMTDQNLYSLSGLVQLLRQVLYLIIIIEVIGALVLGVYLLKFYSNPFEALFHGAFMSVSATTNGGFDITGASLIPYANDYFVQFINIILIILGAIGFPVLVEVKNFLFNKSSAKFQFTLFAKLTSVTFFALIIFGTFMIILLEFNHFFQGKSWHESFFYAFFQSVSTRSGGLSTMDVSQFSEPTLLLLSGLMFIGASPSSVGGGIRTTTLALNVLFLYHFARGNKRIKVFKREISEIDIRKAIVVSLTGFSICVGAVFTLSITESFTLTEILFEVCSAFGTTGLSMGITPDLSTFGKFVLIVCMFIGRVGIVTFIFMIGGKEKQVKYRYPEERIIIG